LCLRVALRRQEWAELTGSAEPGVSAGEKIPR